MIPHQPFKIDGVISYQVGTASTYIRSNVIGALFGDPIIHLEGRLPGKPGTAYQLTAEIIAPNKLVIVEARKVSYESVMLSNRLLVSKGRGENAEPLVISTLNRNDLFQSIFNTCTVIFEREDRADITLMTDALGLAREFYFQKTLDEGDSGPWYHLHRPSTEVLVGHRQTQDLATFYDWMIEAIMNHAFIVYGGEDDGT